MHKLALSFSLCSSVVLFAAEPEHHPAHERLSAAARVFNQVMATPDQAIPQDLLDKAHCVIILPGMSQASSSHGDVLGRGFAVCRHNRANWGGPAGIRVEGASGGSQIGESNTDFVMLVMSDRGMQHLLDDGCTLSEATVAAGPVGRQASASTAIQTSAEILAWSRSKGLFAGVALHGAGLRPDNDANQALYGSELLTTKEILTGDRPTVVGSMGLLTAALNRYSPGGYTGRAKTKK